MDLGIPGPSFCHFYVFEKVNYALKCLSPLKYFIENQIIGF